jgi:adenylate cyclase
MERKLAAIMAADIVGYSRLMAEDEASTYADLRAVFDELIDPTVERHGGRNFKTTGDGFLAIFPSVNEAVDAALAIQNGFDNGRFKLRIGINLGDVIEDNGDVYGDGVNVAARLETMTEPGQIFVSGAVFMATDRNRADIFARVGRRRAKNIPELLNVYRVRRPDSHWSAWRRLSHVLCGTAARWSYGVAALALILIGTQIAPLPLAAMVSRIPAALSLDQTREDPRPSVAVMPFATMSGGAEEQSYFADGLTEDVTTALARNSELQVIARDSTYAVRGQDSDVRKLGQKLGVSYVVEGSARREGDRLRVSAQLIDVKTGAHLWSRSFDRQVADVFTVQSELTTEIVAQLAPYIGRSEAAAAAQRPTDNLQAYDLVLQARDRYRHGTNDVKGLQEARAFYQRALEMDPSYAAARAGLGLTYIAEVAQLPAGRTNGLDTGLSEARQAVRLDPNLGLGYQIISFGLALQGDYSGGMQAARRAVELNPNDPDSMMALAKAQVRFGDYDEAVSNAERARRLHPMAPEYYAYVHGQALYAADRREEAATVISECLVRAPRDANCLLIQAALQGGSGEIEAAQTTMRSLIDVYPTFSLEAERAYRRFGDEPLMDRFLSDLTRATAPKTA